jgi:serine/threonine protein kinase
VLREERAYHICKTLAQTVDPNGHHVARPLDSLRLPGQGEDGPISVCIFEDLGPNYLSKVIDYGPAWFYLRVQGDEAQPYPPRNFTPESMSLQTFLDFAIGAAECIEVLHGQQIVHGEIRGDSFHVNAETGRVTLINFGPGRLRTFEHGLTSTGWSTMSKELGAKTKLAYMSPEQTGRMPLEPDSRTDIFSLGVLFWTILLQKPAFEGETPMDIIQAVLGQRLPLISNIRLDIPEVIGRIIQKATAKTIWDRYHSVGGLRYDLVEIRRLLGLGDFAQLLKWEIAKKDVSPSFILPQAMVGRANEHDTIVRVIDNAYRIRQTRQRLNKHSTTGSTQLSRLSEDHFASPEVPFAPRDVCLEDGSGSSMDGRTHRLSTSDAANGDPRPYEANTGKSRSRANSSQESNNISALSLSDSNLKASEKGISRSLESLNVESVSGDGDGSMSGSDGIGGIVMNRNHISIRTHGRCEVITIAGAAGLGKSRLVQSVQVEARRRGYFASSKFDKNQTENTPFDSILQLLSSLFQQVFSESHLDPVFHQTLKRRVAPVWTTLHKMLGLPEILFGSKLPIRTASQSTRYNETLGAEVRERDSSPKSTISRRGRGSLANKTLGAQSSRNFLLAGSSTQSMSLMHIILDILRLFSRHKLICFCLDDLHLADEESLELIAQIVSTRVSMVIILAYRPEQVLSDTMRRILDPTNDEGICLMRNYMRCR